MKVDYLVKSWGTVNTLNGLILVCTPGHLCRLRSPGFAIHINAVHLQQPRITTSLKNAKKFIEADQMEVRCLVMRPKVFLTDWSCALQIAMLMPYPRVWNEERTWTINVGAQTPVVWYLRSQVPFLMRLISQWGSSQPVCALDFARAAALLFSSLLSAALLHFASVAYRRTNTAALHSAAIAVHVRTGNVQTARGSVGLLRDVEHQRVQRH